MFQKALLVSALSFSMLTLPAAHAQNREDTDPVFAPQGHDGGPTQILLGVAEFLVGAWTWPGASILQKQLVKADAQLEFAMSWPATEKDRSRLIDALMKNSQNYEGIYTVGDASGLKAGPAYRLEKLKGSPLATEVERQAAIALAQTERTNAREAFLVAGRKAGFFPKSVRSFRKIGSVLIFADVAGRLYVWNGLDADPTFSPGVQLLYHTFFKKKR